MEIKLNLIPQYKKEEMARSERFRTVLRWEAEASMILVLVFLLVLGLNYILQFNLEASTSDLASRQNKEKYDRLALYDQEFKNTNGQVAIIDGIQKDQLYWSRLFEKLSALIPAGITVEKMANKDYQIFIAGNSDTRDNLLALKDKLSQDSCFSNINLPLSDLVSKNNIDFQMDFVIKEECVKNR